MSAILAAAQESDMFGEPDPVAIAHVAPQLEFQGELVRNADLRFLPAKDQLHSIPVVCVELRSTINAAARTCHARYEFTDATRHDAEALAKRLKKGCLVTVLTPLDEMRLIFPHVNSISINQEQTAP